MEPYVPTKRRRACIGLGGVKLCPSTKNKHVCFSPALYLLFIPFMVGCVKKRVFKQHQHDINSPVQSLKFPLPLAITVILGFGPRWDPWPYFCSFRTFTCFEMGPRLEEGSDYYRSLPFCCRVTLTHSHPTLLAVWLDCNCWPISNVITTLQPSRQYWPCRGAKYVEILSPWLRWVSDPWVFRTTSSIFLKQKSNFDNTYKEELNASVWKYICFLLKSVQNSETQIIENSQTIIKRTYK
jgi:hypothetical protein